MIKSGELGSETLILRIVRLFWSAPDPPSESLHCAAKSMEPGGTEIDMEIARMIIS